MTESAGQHSEASSAAPSIAKGKRKVSVTIDAELVAEVEATGQNLSAQVNAALREELARRRRHQALGDLLARLDTENGPLDSAEDEAEIARFMRMLGGPAAGTPSDGRIEPSHGSGRVVPPAQS